MARASHDFIDKSEHLVISMLLFALDLVVQVEAHAIAQHVLEELARAQHLVRIKIDILPVLHWLLW